MFVLLVLVNADESNHQMDWLPRLCGLTGGWLMTSCRIHSRGRAGLPDLGLFARPTIMIRVFHVVLLLTAHKKSCRASGGRSDIVGCQWRGMASQDNSFTLTGLLIYALAKLPCQVPSKVM